MPKAFWRKIFRLIRRVLSFDAHWFDACQGYMDHIAGQLKGITAVLEIVLDTCPAETDQRLARIAFRRIRYRRPPLTKG